MAENPQRIRKNFLVKSLLFLLPVAGLVLYSLYLKLGEAAIFLLVFPMIFAAVGISIMTSNKNWFSKITGFLFGSVGMIPFIGMMNEGIDLSELGRRSCRCTYSTGTCLGIYLQKNRKIYTKRCICF